MHTDAYAYWYGVVWIIYCSVTLRILFELVPVYGVSKKWSSLILFFFWFVRCRTLLCLSSSMSSNSHKFYMSSSVNYSQRAEGNTCLALSPCWFWRSCRNRVWHRHRGKYIPLAPLGWWIRPPVVTSSAGGQHRRDAVRQVRKITRWKNISSHQLRTFGRQGHQRRRCSMILLSALVSNHDAAQQERDVSCDHLYDLWASLSCLFALTVVGRHDAHLLWRLLLAYCSRSRPKSERGHVCVLGRKRFASGGGPRGENIFINDLTLPKCFLAISEEASLKAYLEWKWPSGEK